MRKNLVPATELEEAEQLAEALAASLRLDDALPGPAAGPVAPAAAVVGYGGSSSRAAGTACRARGRAALGLREPEPDDDKIPDKDDDKIPDNQAASGAAAAAPEEQQEEWSLPELVCRAVEAGKHGAKKCRGEYRFVPATPIVQGSAGRKNYFVLLRGRVPGEQGLWTGDWHGFAGYVQSGQGIYPAAVFHGFSTLVEAQAYWEAARGDEPLRDLPERR